MPIHHLAKKVLQSRFARTASSAPTARSPVLQEYFFRLALSEIGITDGEIEVDHYNGRSSHAQIGTLPLVFPQSYVDRVASMKKEKTQDYCFRGIISEKRAWLRKYDDVVESRYGRNQDTKYIFDEAYFDILWSSRFSLAPTGESPWSYRFFEGIMAHCIPVSGDNDEDIFAN